MTDNIDYNYLGVALQWTLIDAPDIDFKSNNKSCPHFKKMKVYFNLLNKAIQTDDKQLYFDVMDRLMERETKNLIHMFFSTILGIVNEAEALERIFDNKDNLTDGNFKFQADVVGNLRTFKNYIKHNKPCCCKA